MQSLNKYDPVGHCIYCGVTEGNGRALTEEHIVAFGLNGNLVIPKASCFRCAKVTGRLEDLCLRKMFGPLRTHLNLRSRRKKHRPKTIPLTVHYGDKVAVDLELPPAEHPFGFCMWKFKPPALLGGDRSDNMAELWVSGTKAYDLHKWNNTSVTMPGETHCGVMSRLVAKTAHAYASAELGTDSFAPLLLPLILSEDLKTAQDKANSVVGGLGPGENPPANANLHDLRLEERTFNGRSFVVVQIRFFSCLGAPIYEAVVGENLQKTISARSASIQRR
jgi:hypothetical protein